MQKRFLRILPYLSYSLLIFMLGVAVGRSLASPIAMIP